MRELNPVMAPEPGSRSLRFVGDRVRFSVRDREGLPPQNGWRALLRTNLGRAEAVRREIILAQTKGVPAAGESWRDLPMRQDEQGWSLTLPLTEPGYFKFKAYLVNPHGWQRWPEGPDAGLSVHPDSYRTANTIYCAFVRMFGRTKTDRATKPGKNDELLKTLDNEDYTVIPSSGKLRDLTRELPHIIKTLGCRILHLLPVHPTPTTYARFGRFGSPYAALDLTAIDPALVVMDRRTTGIDQFRELAYQTHVLGGRLFLDIVINHTGWGSALQENHPDWFLRDHEGTFVSPGAWGTIWDDLVELKHQNVALWDQLAAMFLTWCRRGVDGFRCDAGYKVPVAAWQYIIASVQQEFPDTLFLLEGLGGSWEATENLLTEGGMQWAYSELFQNYTGQEVATYLDYGLRQSGRTGLLVHYSETHDNDRLAARGRTWSLARNRLCALASVSGGYGFTCGAEWLASEKVRVHESTGMNWGAPDNIVSELSRLNNLLSDHPCFFDGARLTRLSELDSVIYALQRESADSRDQLVILANTDPKASAEIKLKRFAGIETWQDLLVEPFVADEKTPAPPAPKIAVAGDGLILFTLAPGAVHCFSPSKFPRGDSGLTYRRSRAQAAWGFKALSALLPARFIPLYPWQELASIVEETPEKFLAAVSRLRDRLASLSDAEKGQANLGSMEALREDLDRPGLPRVIVWESLDRRRITPIPPDHWLFIRDEAPFRAALQTGEGQVLEHVESIAVRGGQIAAFPPRSGPAEGRLELERYADKDQAIQGSVSFLAVDPHIVFEKAQRNDVVLLTNGRGGMARICADLGQVRSKYDCVLGANLHPTLPVDRHILAKRIRVWVNADGFISPLDFCSLVSLRPGPPVMWQFVANAGDGRTVEVEMSAAMVEGRNTTLFRFSRPSAADATGKQLPPNAVVRLTVRLDIEDRNFHCETKRNGGADYHFSTHCHPLPSGPGVETFRGFSFTPAPDRLLNVFSDSGNYHPEPEWSQNIPHPIEQTRGQEASGDAYSPGWFDLPLVKGASVSLVVTAEHEDPSRAEIEPVIQSASYHAPREMALGAQLSQATRAYVVRRGTGQTVIAGYPWFLDWGRDTFICARGLLAAGMTQAVSQIMTVFARFGKDGTLPNTIFGEDASNRDTSDAPLWFGVVCEELVAIVGNGFYQTRVAENGSTIADTLWDIAINYSKGTPNGIRMDPSSGLIWSPSHFTWMDTNYPACTPREGYPIEIQALWIRLLRHLERIGGRTERKGWEALSQQALASVEKMYWLEDRGYYADCLAARPGQSASEAKVDDALRSNYLLLTSLGLVRGDRARRSIQAAIRHLAVPGALRSLAPLPVSLPLPIYGKDGRLLNDPQRPYWGKYEGDEDTRRKPAYHNGTAWTWTFPAFCEALAAAYENSPEAVAAARAYLGSMERLITEGCLGHVPEVLDGDAPHLQRGCDAQAWGETEALRVWQLLSHI